MNAESEEYRISSAGSSYAAAAAGAAGSGGDGGDKNKDSAVIGSIVDQTVNQLSKKNFENQAALEGEVRHPLHTSYLHTLSLYSI